MSDIVQMDLIKQVQELFPPLTSLEPKSYVMNGFGVVPREDGQIDIYDPEGNLVMTLFRDEDGNICGVEDHINKESRAVNLYEDWYGCDPEDDTCTYDETQALNVSAMLFSEEAPKIEDDLEPPPPPPEEEMPKVERESKEIIIEDSSKEEVTESVGGTSHESLYEDPVFLVSSDSQPIEAPLPQYSAEFACNMAGPDLPFGESEQVATKAVAISGKSIEDSNADEDVSVTSEGRTRIDINDEASFASNIYDEASFDRQSASIGDESQTDSLKVSAGSMDLEVEMERDEDRAERVFVASENQGSEDSLNATSHEHSSQSVRLSAHNDEDVDHKTITDSPEAVLGDVPEHNFVGAPVVLTSRAEVSGSQVYGKGADETSRQNIKTVDHQNDADRHQGDPDQDHGSGHHESQEEDADDFPQN